MDISFYVLLVLACLVLALAMWACAGSGTKKWGPDLTLELPPHLLQQALFGTPSTNSSTKLYDFGPTATPSAPSEHLYDPLLRNEHAISVTKPPVPPRPPPLKNYYPSPTKNGSIKKYPAPVKERPPSAKECPSSAKERLSSAKAATIKNHNGGVKVLPQRYIHVSKNRAPFSTFSSGESV